MAKLKGSERAVVIAQLAAQINDPTRWAPEDCVAEADKLLKLAEDYVAKEYGEFR